MEVVKTMKRPLVVEEARYVCKYAQDHIHGWRPGMIIMVGDPRTSQVIRHYREWWEPIEDEL